MTIVIDGAQDGQAVVGDVVLAAGSDVVIGSAAMPGTIFREVVVTTGPAGQ